MRLLFAALAGAVALSGASAAVYPRGNFTVGSNLAFFQNLTDSQLASIFTNYGVASMPSQEKIYNIPEGEAWYDFCVGRTLINAATTKASDLISGTWPMGPSHPLNNLFMRGWWGKVFYNDGSNPDVVQMWNLLYSNGTVDFNAIAYINGSERVTNDNQDSMFVDYALTDFAPFRSVIDEVRLVNAEANIYLGHIWASNPIDSLVKKGYKNKLDEVIYRGKLAALNSTWLDFVGFTGLDTVASLRDTPADYFTLGWFVMQCIGPKAPKLKYAWTAYFVTLLDIITGLYRPEATLPGIPFVPSKDPTRVGPGFPSPSYGVGKFPKLHIWPFKVSDIGQVGTNVSKIPAFKGEPVLGEAKLYPIVTEGISNWFGEGQPDPSWTPNELELKAADIAKWVNGPFAKMVGKTYAINGTIGDTLPADHVNPTWNAAMVAIHAVQAANEAAKEAAANPTAHVNKLAKLLKTKEYTGKVLVNFGDGFVGSTVRGILANKAPVYNLTGFADYMDKIKHQPMHSFPKLNYTPPAIVWEGDLKNATSHLSPLDMKIGGKNLTAWKDDLKAVLVKDDGVVYQHELKAVQGHAMRGGRKMV